MRTLEEFEHFYSTVLKQKLSDLEDLRNRTKTKYYVLVVSTIFIILVCSLLFLCVEELFVLFPLSFMFGIVSYPFFSYLIIEKYRLTFKKSIISEMVLFYDESLKYEPDKGIFLKAIQISNLFYLSMKEKFVSDDYVEGKIGETFVQFSEIQISSTSFFSSADFHGLFLIADFNKHFKGDYIILPDPFEKLLGSAVADTMQHFNIMYRPPLIKMENPEFENEFAVYGTDEIEARYIITPALMDRMLDYKTKVGNKVYFSFTRSRLFVAISTDKELFEPTLFSSPDPKQIELWNKDLYLALSIVNELNLNTRIWSKR